jgi:hypothetical protein
MSTRTARHHQEIFELLGDDAVEDCFFVYAERILPMNRQLRDPEGLGALLWLVISLSTGPISTNLPGNTAIVVRVIRPD